LPTRRQHGKADLVAEIEAQSDGNAVNARDERSRLRRVVNRRTVVRTGAVVLALLGVVALVVRPATRTRAEARVTIPSPLVVGDAVGAILARADGATATAVSRRVTVSSSAANRDAARARAETLARAGLDAASQQAVAVYTRRADAARSDRAGAAAQLATLASRTGFTDPEPAYRQHVAVVHDLQQQLAAAAAAGQPLATINAQLAENQQAAFELQLQVTRHTELVNTETTAARSEQAATGEIDKAKRATTLAPVAVTDHATGSGFGIPVGIAALVLAGIVFLAGGRRPRRAVVSEEVVSEEVVLREVEREAPPPEPKIEPETEPEPEPEPVATLAAAVDLPASEAAALGSCGLRESRYLEFYRALAPTPNGALEPPTVPVDLVHEEALEELQAVDESEDPEPEPAREHDGSLP
jgi:hypothetical protein